jgi:hypothetical protein
MKKQLTAKKKQIHPPKFVPTQEQRDFIDQMAGMHMTVTDIALAIGVSRRTLYKYFRAELMAGSARLHATVLCGAQSQSAVGVANGNAQSAMEVGQVRPEGNAVHSARQ